VSEVAPVDKAKYHDTHVLIRRDLYERIQKHTKRTEKDFTDILNYALRHYLVCLDSQKKES